MKASALASASLALAVVTPSAQEPPGSSTRAAKPRCARRFSARTGSSPPAGIIRSRPASGFCFDAKTREIIVINGQGPAPKAATPPLSAADGKVPSNGPLGATIPAMMDAMPLALETKGTLRLERSRRDVPAADLARTLRGGADPRRERYVFGW
jgi:hypothetical protein